MIRERQLIGHLHLVLFPEVLVNGPGLAGDLEGKTGRGRLQVLMLPSFDVDKFIVISFIPFTSDQTACRDFGISPHSCSAVMKNWFHERANGSEGNYKCSSS